MNNVLKFLRGAVRPVVTMGLVAAFAAAAFYDDDAAKVLGPPAMLIVGYWFRDRTNKTSENA